MPKAASVAEDLPDRLSYEAHVAPRRAPWGTWARRVCVTLLAVLPVLGLLNTFGQMPVVSEDVASAATLRVVAPADLRGGLIFQVRVDVTAHQPIKNAILVFSRSWWESLTTNAITPQPSNDTSLNGNPAFTLGNLQPGKLATYWFYFQVNPTLVGFHRHEAVWLEAGTHVVASVHRLISIYP